MARREWADKAIEKIARYVWQNGFPMVPPTKAARRLKAEHARAVRIVKARDKWLLGGGYDNMSNDFQAGYHQACNDLLAALTKGRA